MKNFRKQTFAAVMTLLVTGAVAAPSVDFDAGAVIQVGVVLSNPQREPAVAVRPVDPTQFAVAFGENGDIVVQTRNTSTGAVIETTTIPSASTGYTTGEIAITYTPNSSEIVVGWGVGNDTGVRLQRFNASTLATVGGVVNVIADYGNKPKFDFFSDGSLLVAYEGGDGPGNSGGVVARRYLADGSPAGGEFVLNDPNVTGAQNDPAIAIRRTGNFATDIVLAVWEDDGFSRFGVGNDDINVRRFDSSLTPLGPAAAVVGANLTTVGPDQRSKIGNPAVAFAPTGESIVVFEGEDVPSGGEKLYAQIYDAAGTAIGTDAIRISGVTAPGRQQAVSARYHAASNTFAIVWGTRSSTDVYIRFISLDGVLQGGETKLNGSESTDTRRVNFDLATNTGVAAWNNNATNNAYLRIFSIVSNPTNVESWMSYE